MESYFLKVTLKLPLLEKVTFRYFSVTFLKSTTANHNGRALGLSSLKDVP